MRAPDSFLKLSVSCGCAKAVFADDDAITRRMVIDLADQPMLGLDLEPREALLPEALAKYEEKSTLPPDRVTRTASVNSLLWSALKAEMPFWMQSVRSNVRSRKPMCAAFMATR